jgi:hypothetical protein
MQTPVSGLPNALPGVATKMCTPDRMALSCIWNETPVHLYIHIYTYIIN